MTRARVAGWIVCGVAGAFVALLAQRVLDPPLAFASVDLAALVSEHLQADATSGTSVDVPATAGRFAVRLEVETRRLADEYGVTLLAAPAVIAGMPDLTPMLRARLQDIARGAGGESKGETR
jgi:hypothetical protein